ncbi:MAG: class I SAM-dependent methyltransferase [candidate division KSB1 bacterium]|nr:class I SAM-dependent methyltransferase [candidate division KSB1 bacterium]MDZ7273649.1 class I SAM-dependent methyltransferase [candidate division KSB1 bacterium]MDZ7286760.1 class I SAM-dependent methyltransferase [candidate division KSB1 bacterium]MDZ7299883.1 class I SAM-dependent methyltransferase [candidate division KSB1 bacterium]MDZ7305820.1 class I SAM-dependent methyltransferase [candidate division KSB1 bacterium]
METAINQLAGRIAELPPEKRALFERLLREKGLPLPDDQSASGNTPAAEELAEVRESVREFFRRAAEDQSETAWHQPHPQSETIKSVTRKFYDAINRQLDASLFGSAAAFLNYGYAPDGSPEYSTIAVPRHYPNRHSLKLMLEVIGERDLTGAAVLDIGCGRGGMVQTLLRYFSPARVTGMDLSGGAVRFCQKNGDPRRSHFLQADAEKLPLAAAAFDCVTNVESSHNYPNRRDFYAEVFRVLKPGGWFLYADLLTLKQWQAAETWLAQMGFAITRNQDITGNVLRACDETAAARLAAFQQAGAGEQDLLGDFLAVPGSKPYDNMKLGISAYKILWLQKNTGVGTEGTGA